MKLFKNKKFKYGGAAAALTALFIVAVILINLIASMLISHYDWKIDLTSSQKYQISDQTTAFLKDYDKDVQIIVLNSEQAFKTESAYTLQAYNVLKNMVAQNPTHLSLDFVDLNENPGFASQYSDEQLQTDGVLVVDSEGNHRYLSTSDLFITSYSSSEQTVEISSDVEEQVAHALEYISGENPVSIDVITGHSETDISSIQGTIESNGYDFTSSNLITDGIPEGTDVVFIDAPTVDYSTDDIAKLSDYLNQGGSVVYFAAASQPQLPNLEGLLSQYGITFSTGTVIETNTRNIAGRAIDSF